MAVFWRLRCNRNGKNTAGRTRGSGLVIQRTVDAVVDVVESPAVDHPTGFFHVQEQLSFEELVT